MTQSYVRSLLGGGAAVTEVGGKAAGLDLLVAQGFPVPRAVAITVEAYWSVVAHAGLEPRLAALARAAVPSPEDLDAELDRIGELFAAAPLPPDLEDEIRRTAAALLEHGPIVIRSSPLAEETAVASLAGQYHAELGITTEADAVAAVRRCWASLWAPAVRAFRTQEGMADIEPAMAVVLQTMVPAEQSGVLFSRDPIGDPECACIEMAGGRHLAAGEPPTPDVFWVSRETLAITGHQGRIPAFIEDLTRLGMLVERRLGSPQSIEWAYAEGRLLLLQTRPVSTRALARSDDDGTDTVPADHDVYTSAGIQEMLPGVVSPLLWSINAPMLDDAFRRLFGMLGIPIPADRDRFMALARFRGRAALNLSVLRRAAAAMPGGGPDDVDLQYLGRVIDDLPERELPPPESRRSRLRIGLRAVRIRKRLEIETKLVTDSTHLILALGVDAATLPVDRLLAYWARIRDLAWRTYAVEVAASAGAAAAYRALETTLARWLEPADAARWSQRVTAGPVAARQPGCSCVAEFWEVYAGRLPDVDLGAVLDHSDALNERERRLMDLMSRTSRHFGSKSVYGGVTWDEDRTVVRECFRSLSAGLTADPEVRLAAAQRERAEAIAHLRRALRSSWRWRTTRIITGQFVDIRSRMVERLATDAARLLALREESKATLLTLGGEERRLIREAAKRLVASGVLRTPDDIGLLSATELEAGLLGREPAPAREIERRRLASRLAASGNPLPECFRGIPTETAPPPPDSHVFQGWAASPGVVAGTARVIDDVSDGGSLQRGDILVARSTDPSWTPLFMVAGGIVLEEGGPLSHAAIVAREFGLPAVLSVRGATRIIASGEQISVDGTSGKVIRLAEETVS